MGKNSNISWTDHTFNPWIGCSKVSAGCKNCYAEADMDKRRKRVQWGVNGTRSVTSYAYWRQAISWNREDEKERKRVFCASLADVFEDWEGVVVDSKGNDLFWNDALSESSLALAHVCNDDFAGEQYCDVEGIPTFSHHTADNISKFHSKTISGWLPLTLNTIREYLFRLIQMTPNLDWLLLTKRPENVMKMVPPHWQREFPPNVWIGTSVEDMEQARIRIPHLSKIPAYVRFLSCEPLLEQVNFLHRLLQINDNGLWLYNSKKMQQMQEDYPKFGMKPPSQPFDWIIVGGESGREKRPFDCEWARIIRDECKEAGIPFFMKQVDKVQPIPEDLMIYEFPKSIIHTTT